ncbi:MAG: 30S ribosomal protein S6 [Solirubrobacterales bacterium]|nr:30S ribosomal protein S6 [Solirubrobacterales bacterium]
MLDPDTPDERRDQIATDARQRIESSGSLKTENVWGVRKLAYEIGQRTEADYRFFRFETESPLLDELDHNLKITDGVLRFRIFKVDPSSPVIEPPPPVSLASPAPTRGPGGRRGGPGGRPPREDAGDRETESPAPAPAAEQPPAAQPSPAQPPPAQPPAPETPAATPAPEPAPAQPPASEPPAPEAAPAEAPAAEEPTTSEPPAAEPPGSETPPAPEPDRPAQ